MKAYNLLPNRMHPLYRLCLLYHKLHNNACFIKYASILLDFKPKINSDLTDFYKNDIKSILRSYK